MLKNFRNAVLAQLALLAFVGCSMTLHATTLSCTNTITLGAGGFVLDSQITSGTCVQVGDKLFGDFSIGRIPTGALNFSSNGASNRASISFLGTFVPGATYNFSYEVEVTNSPNVITSLAADVVQTAGTSSLLVTVTPTGSGTINFTKTGNTVSGPSEVTFTQAQGVTDLTVITESFMLGPGSDSSAVLNTITQSPPARVPEPEASSMLLFGMGLVAGGGVLCRKLRLDFTAVP